MLEFKINIKGQINEVKLPAYKALWPLFETIVNSIQAIEDSSNCTNGKIRILAERLTDRQINIKKEEELTPFSNFIVEDNGEGFNSINYSSFLEAYTSLKVSKGCKGIGRFLWLKAFEEVHIDSNYCEKGKWFNRSFDFTAENGVEPEDNIQESGNAEYITKVSLNNFIKEYRDHTHTPVKLEALAKKIIEHCLPYFLSSDCPQIILEDNFGDKVDLNQYYNERIKDSLHQDKFKIENEYFTLYHIMMYEGAKSHELHFCANKREVKSLNLVKTIPDLHNKIMPSDGRPFYYLGYLVGSYLDKRVNMNRTAFDFEGEGEEYYEGITVSNIVETAKEYVMAYLEEDLKRIRSNKERFVRNYVYNEKPQYRYLINNKPDILERLPSGDNKTKLELELHKMSQEWEYEIKKEGIELEKNFVEGNFSEEFNKRFNSYCSSITDISKSSLSEYVIRRKTIVDLLEKALEVQEDDKYYKEDVVHSIICPMHVTSDEIQFDEMNLWLIDDRLSYHRFLASDKLIKSLPVIESDCSERMDIAIFDQAVCFSADEDIYNAITIIELKRPNRNDLDKEDKNPINQVLGYVEDIRSGKLKKANGRDFGNVQNTAFYGYIIVDLTEKMHRAAKLAGLYRTPDGEGYYGYNTPYNVYLEVISYTKLLRDAKKRNQRLFDKLFSPKSNEVINL